MATLSLLVRPFARSTQWAFHPPLAAMLLALLLCLGAARSATAATLFPGHPLLGTDGSFTGPATPLSSDTSTAS